MQQTNSNNNKCQSSHRCPAARIVFCFFHECISSERFALLANTPTAADTADDDSLHTHTQQTTIIADPIHFVISKKGENHLRTFWASVNICARIQMYGRRTYSLNGAADRRQKFTIYFSWGFQKLHSKRIVMNAIEFQIPNNTPSSLLLLSL